MRIALRGPRALPLGIGAGCVNCRRLPDQDAHQRRRYALAIDQLSSGVRAVMPAP